MRRFVIMAVVLMISTAPSVVCADQKLPFPAGETWWVSQGNGGTVSHNLNSTRYAWDFNYPGGADLGRPVLTTESGEVVSIRADCLVGDLTCNGKWGNVVRVKYSDGTYGRFAHLQEVLVKVGQSIQRGQMVGTCGTTGYSTGAHIHYQREGANGNAIPSSFEDVTRDGGIPIGCNCTNESAADSEDYYTSTNIPHGPGFFSAYDGWDSDISPKFLDAYQAHGGYSGLGTPFDNGGGEYVHEWIGPEGQHYNIWLQNFEGGNFSDGDGQSALIHNPTHKKAYLVKQGFWCVYKGFNDCYPGSDRDIVGPVNLGAPTSEETNCKEEGNGTCQYFEYGRLRFASPIKVTYGDYSAGPPGSPFYPQGPDPICKHYSQLSVAQRATYYDGQMWNTTSDLCDGFGWQSDYCTGTVYSGTGCGLWSDPYDQGECWLGMNQDMVTSPPNIYHGQFYTSSDWPLDIDETKQYRLSFRARNHDPDVLPRNMKIILTAGDNYCSDWPLYTLEDQYTLVSDEQEITIENNYPDWQDYEVVLTPELSSSEATLRFFFGDKKGQIDVDDIVWTAEDQPVEDAPEVSNLLVNGDAENPNAGEWGLYNAYNVANFSRADWQVYDGDYSWYLTNALSAPECWYSQWRQTVTVQAGQSYTLSYQVASKDIMQMAVAAQQANGTLDYYSDEVVLRPTPQTKSHVFTASASGPLTISFRFGNGSFVRIRLDDVSLIATP